LELINIVLKTKKKRLNVNNI